MAKPIGETVLHVDKGRNRNILQINKEAGKHLIEGDIKEGVLRNTIIGDEYRWPTTVPFYLDDSLDVNAKGVILKTFDEFRLRTCIDFAPWEGEENYISVFNDDGCYSYVGNQHVGKQELSIGWGCELIATVEHEFLHALGFWHEQSRSDRDDYIDIIWRNIEPDNQYNFDRENDTVSSALGVPYDYMSVMHYEKTAFGLENQITMLPKNPHYVDVIGQDMGFSASDLTKLSRLYKCTTSTTFVDSCSFDDDNICGMIDGPGNKKWEWRDSVEGGPESDFTTMGQREGNSYFMHFNTASANPGDHAILRSRMLYPKPGAQCLQFFLFNTGAADDTLHIWVREYDETNPKGKLQHFKTISGGETGVWNLYQVNINVVNKARVIFEGVRGKQPSSGGLSLDDINLSSTKCPHHIWPIRNITNILENTGEINSPRFLSPTTGYSFQITLQPNGLDDELGDMGVFFHLTSGPNDHNLNWPCPWHQVTMTLMDQQPDIRQQMNQHHMLTTDPTLKSDDGTYMWGNPRSVGEKVTDPDGSSFYRGEGLGASPFITRTRLKSRDFIKGDTAFFLFSLEDRPQEVTSGDEIDLRAEEPQFGVSCIARGCHLA
uniref:Metalloendopeptidase n=1 Tax=Sphaeramia orbicularis TaxID=375764 RepID=A0A672YZN0_9TELE